ncbi:MAG: DUF1573 domain-containing protein [Kiritimatiellae bacterium]|nr:DUF1573 domain-containing protein [Kiritimatiellia bacterium]
MLKTLITASLYVGTLFVSVDAVCDEIYEVYMVERNLSVDEARKYGIEISGFDVGKDGVEIYVKCTNSVSERLCESIKLLRTELYSADVSIGDVVTSLAIPRHGSEYSWHVTIPRESIAQSKLFLCYGYSQEYIQFSIGLDKVLCSQKEVIANASCVSDIPRLAVPPEGVAFGEIAAGEAASKSIALRNVSSSPVVVSQVKGCCGADAALSAMRIEPAAVVTLSVSLKAMLPGEFSKHVQILCDDPESPVINIPVAGTAVEGGAPFVGSRFTLPAVLLAGIADGFNPCAFSIVIVLAGVLAVGGRRRRARLVGGVAFCVGSYLTYMAMGLGLLKAIKALDSLRVVYDVVMLVLAASLFVLAFLSFRDAFRYRRERTPKAITLQLPDKVKRLIRAVAEASWSGPAVVVASLGCGFLVTLLDSLCTGQIYVPVLALISREPGAWRSFALLALYNLAFIAPLVAVFVLAAKGADSERMSRWSKRNVFPSKLGLGMIFAVLGILLLIPVVSPGYSLTGSDPSI